MITTDGLNVIEGYMARDKYPYLWIYEEKPIRRRDIWESINGDYYELPNKLFPNLKWEDEPIKVELTIKAIK